VPGSLKVNTAFTGTNPADGLTITTINPRQTVIITWQVKAGDVIPLPNPVTNTATVVVPGLPPQHSNTVTVMVNNANIRAFKAVDKLSVKPCCILTYTIILTNTGNVPATGVILIDNIPKCTVFVKCSLIINGIKCPARNFLNEIKLADIAPGEIVTVSFKVRVLKIKGLAFKAISNKATIRFKHIVNPEEPPVTKVNESNTTVTLVCSRK
jgi:uncharacterized repeat protein (TIGR01451 family)